MPGTDALPDIAFSVFNPHNGPHTLLNPVILKYPPRYIKFAGDHECAHHKLGHARIIFHLSVRGLQLKPESFHEFERKADCEAVRSGGYDAETIRFVFNHFPETDPLHPTREERIQNAVSCLKASASPAAVVR
jgi:hypothetical protein